MCIIGKEEQEEEEEEPFRISGWNLASKKLESWGYRMVKIS